MIQQSSLIEEVFIVDHEPLVRDELASIFAMEGYQVTSFAEAESFLAATRERTPAFVLLDVNMPDRSALDLLVEINARTYPIPVFVISGHDDIASAMDAIKIGALELIEKPFHAELVAARVRRALASWVRTRADEQRGILSRQFPGYHLLTPRERDVLALIAGGASNKEAGRELGISPRTVEVHRARIMDKIAAKNAADLVRIVLSTGQQDDLSAAAEIGKSPQAAARRRSGAKRP